MSNNFDALITALQEEKKPLIESKEGRRFIKFFMKLNSDPAHFIWEILQNAEDVHATEISFTLNENSINIRHNGNPFTNSNIESICTILDSDKQLTEGQIGKFGIGFKTVFAYTDAPEIYSAEKAFRITKLFYPEKIPMIPGVGKDTVFILPFMYPEKAKAEISKKLRDISTEALLFLKFIKTLKIKINGIERIISRDTKESTDVRNNMIFEHIIVTDSSKEKIYYRFSLNNISLKDKDEFGNLETYDNQSVMIAYRLDSNRKFIPISKSKDINKYFVFFPTEIPTSLEYLVHAPFKTTINRETIIGNSNANDTLYEMLMRLVVFSIVFLIKRKEVTTDFYNQILFPGGAVFPTGRLYDMLKSILVQVLSKDSEILPTFDGGYASLSEILIETYRYSDCKGIIKKAFTVEEISEHIPKFKNRKYWDAGYFNTNLHRLISYTKNEVNFGEMELSLSEILDPKNLKPYWLHQKTPEDLKKIYEIFYSSDYHPTNLPDLNNNLQHYLNNIAFIRKPDGSQVTRENAYWRKEDIAPFFMEDPYCKSFLKDYLKISEYDTTSALKEDIKTKYRSENTNCTLEENIADIEKIIEAVLSKKVNAKDLDLFYYICGVNAKTGAMKWCRPADVFLTGETGGSTLVESLLQGSPDIFFVDPEYSKFSGKLEYLGIKSKLNLLTEDSDTCSPIVEQQIRDQSERISRSSFYIFPKNDFKPNTSLPYFREIISSMTFEKSLVLFKWLSSKTNYIKGVVEWNTNRQNATSGTSQHGTVEIFSEFAYRLWTSDWMYGKDGIPRSPRKLSYSTIRDEYLENQELLEIFGVSGIKTQKLSSIVAEKIDDISDGLRKSLDIIGAMTEEEQIEFCQSYGKKASTKSIFEAMLNQTKEDYSVYTDDEDDELHPSPVINPEKRSQKIRDELNNEMESARDEMKAETEETNLKLKRLLKSATSKDEQTFRASFGSAINSHFSFSNSTAAERAFLIQEYQGRCQICGTRIRKFLTKGSSQFPYHFVARNVIKTGDLNDLYKSSEVIDGWNSLSLCPMCAAKYYYCSKNVNSFIDQVMQIRIRPRVPEIFEISITLDGKEEKICYTPKHMLALQEALKFFMENEEKQQ